jgi:SAM-dependent methyltransferase
MTGWVAIFLVLTGVLFGVKMLYALSVALALPFTRGALYVSTSRKRIEAFADALNMKSGQVLIDLGCGDGRVLRCIRRRFGAKVIGYELNLLAYLKARLMCLGRRGITIRFRDFRKADLSDADVVFCYLFPDVLPDLALKLGRELKPGAVVVSANFAIPGWRSQQVLRSGHGRQGDPLYFYRV